jgi:hypothetical protein
MKMKLSCNIDQRGRKARLIGSRYLMTVAILLATGGWLMHLPWLFWAALTAFLVGAFMLFEARKGWCMLRAMGFRTRL